MDITAITQVISTVGFPIAVCLIMAYYVKYISDKNREDINKLNEQHKEELVDMVKAIDNNTMALNTLCEKLGGSYEA